MTKSFLSKIIEPKGYMTTSSLNTYKQCIPAIIHPNFKMLPPRWVCLFQCFWCTRSAQKGISRITCVPYLLLKSSPLTRQRLCKPEKKVKIPKVDIFSSNLLQFSDDGEEFPLTLSKIYFLYLRYTLKVYSPCKIY